MTRLLNSVLARSALGALAWIAVAPAAWCTTWIVDSANGPGTNFTDIPPAIAAAAPGDVIIVRTGNGNYSGFTLGRGISVIGQGSLFTSGPILVSGVPAGEIAVVSRVQPAPNTYWQVKVTSCAGTVLLQNLDALLDVRSSADVRVLKVTSGPQVMGQIDALYMESSRVQVVQSSLLGGFGTPTWYPNCLGGESGGMGIACWFASRLHFACSTATGGEGTCSNPNCGLQQCYGGGTGVRGISNCSLILTGGDGIGLAAGGPGPYQGYSLGLSLNANAWSSQMSYTQGPPALFSGSTLTYLPTQAPTLQLLGAPAPGATITLRLNAQPGEVARLIAGTVPILQPTPNVLVERLVVPRHSFDLGIVPASGIIDTPWQYRLQTPKGYLVVFQASLVDPIGGGVQRSNSIEAVVQ